MPPKTLTLACAVLLSSVASLPAAAQTAPAEPSETATTDDADGPSHALTGAAVIFNMMDQNGDGALDIDEVGALTRAIFTTLDRDDNGVLSKDEINTALRRMQGGGPWSGQGPRAPQVRGGPGDGLGVPHIQGDAEHFREAVRNRFGPGGPQFPPRPQLPNFGNLDRNDDGVISQEEFEAAVPRPQPR